MLASILLFSAQAGALALAPRARNRWLWLPPALLLAALLLAPNRLIASKFIGRLLMPGGLLWLGLIAQSLYQLRTQPKRAALPLAFLLLYTLFGNVYFGGLLLRWLERDFVKAQYLQSPPEPFDALLFYFRVSNITPKQKIRFNIINFVKNHSLYKEGMRPYAFKKSKGTWSQEGINCEFRKRKFRYDESESPVIMGSLSFTYNFES